MMQVQSAWTEPLLGEGIMGLAENVLYIKSSVTSNLAPVDDTQPYSPGFSPSSNPTGQQGR